MGRCPKTPVAGCAGYGLIFDGSPKSIRTAHRIAPKVAAGASALSPHPLSRCGKGARMGWQLQIDSNVLGVLGLAKSQAADLKVFAFPPHSSPPPRRGQGWWFAVLRSSAAAIKMRRRLFLSPSACSTDLFLGGSLKINSYPAQQGDRVFRAQP